MNIASELVSLKQIVERNYFFRVPIYQRLYVWGNDQVETLLADLLSAYKEEKEIYYLGGVIVVDAESERSHRVFDLIDGQQRFTTLWLMGHVWQAKLQPFLYDIERPGQYRIEFPIRENVKRLLTQDIVPVDDRVTPVFQPIVDARAVIQSYLNDEYALIDIDDFSQFIYEKVNLVLTTVPKHTDLNKLFAVINNRGVQLQHHEILKAKLLGRLHDPAERERYSVLWDAVSEMGDYVERTLKHMAKLDLVPLLDGQACIDDHESYIAAESVLALLAQHQTQTKAMPTRGLDEILAGDIPLEIGAQKSQEVDDDWDEADDVRSIVTFPVLLQHTLRVWLHRQGVPDLDKILDKELLDIFDRHFFTPHIGVEDVKSFIRVLWEIRYLFDAHIIKWVSMGEEEWHNISRLRRTEQRDKLRFYRNKRGSLEDQGFALLQSMLYHSQQITTHYWLTPLLAYLHRNPEQSISHYYTYLRHLDNHLLCSTDTSPLIVRSRKFLDEPWQQEALTANILNEAHGTEFPHYWFYKLEFILWYLRVSGSDEHRLNDFRITAKNSIEHISPQHAQDVDANRVSEQTLNTFGNLALVSRSINSEYGNKPFNEKRQRFLNRNAKRIDSLKMLDIYQYEKWNDAEAQEHQERMVGAINRYLQEDHQTRAAQVAVQGESS